MCPVCIAKGVIAISSLYGAYRDVLNEDPEKLAYLSKKSSKTKKTFGYQILKNKVQKSLYLRYYFMGPQVLPLIYPLLYIQRTFIVALADLLSKYFWPPTNRLVEESSELVPTKHCC